MLFILIEANFHFSSRQFMFDVRILVSLKNGCEHALVLEYCWMRLFQQTFNYRMLITERKKTLMLIFIFYIAYPHIRPDELAIRGMNHAMSNGIARIIPSTTTDTHSYITMCTRWNEAWKSANVTEDTCDVCHIYKRNLYEKLANWLCTYFTSLFIIFPLLIWC